MEFDYVIAGGGSAGCALAARLAERSDLSVALLEAGPPDHHALVTTPIGAAVMLPMRGARNWALQTEPQSGLGGRLGYQPRGRGLGGSSSLNAMIYTRGHRADYDGWAALGCEGWSFDEVCPTSGAPSATRAAPDATTIPGMAAAVRRTCRTWPARTRSRWRSSRRRCRPAIGATTTSTAPSRRAWVSTRSRSTAASAGTRPAPTCTGATGPTGRTAADAPISKC